MQGSSQESSSEVGIGTTLRRHGYRLTPPRKKVWSVLAGANGHLTVDQIAREVDRHSPPPVNLASIYRALDLFSTLGLVRETRLGGEGGGRWELAHPDDEFHLVCSSCGRVEHHGGALVESIRNHLQVDHSFQVVDVELAVTGHCPACAAG